MKFGKLSAVALLGGALLLGGCGDGGDSAEPADAVATPTIIATVEITPETAVEEITETGDVTGTEEMTGAEGVTGTEEMTGAEDITGAEGVTGTEEMTGAEDITGAEGVTGTEEMTGAADISGAEGITDARGMTETGQTEMPAVTTGEEMTGTASAGLTGTITDTITDTAMMEDVAVSGVVRSSELLGYGVENFEEEDLGSVNDAIVSLEHGCIDYLVLSFGGILGLGDNLYLIPWRAVEIDPADQRLVLNVDPQALNDAPIWDAANLPDMSAVDWDADILGYWENIALLEPAEVADTTTAAEGMAGECAGAMTAAAGDAPETTTVTETTDAGTGALEVQTPRVIRLSELSGYNVTNPDGEDLGEIEDLMIDWRQDQIAYAILSFGGILGLGERWFPVPLDRLTLDPVEQRLVFDVEPELLETAPGFDEMSLPDTTDANWDEEIRSFWESMQ